VIARRRLLAAIALAAFLTMPATVGAADVSALSGGIHATGTIVVQTNISGAPITIGGNIALYRRGNFYRLDLLSLAFPGTSSAMSAAAGALLAPGGATVIYDGTSGALSAYSNANRSYYSEAPKTPPARNPVPSGGALPVASDPLDTLAGVARQLRDVQTASLQLTGRGTTNGHPVANIDVLLRRQLPGKPQESYHATFALADDLDGFPVEILLSITPPTPNDLGGNMRLELLSVVPEVPADSAFAVPAGYTRVSSIGDVLRPAH
jgi:hypothetical protein